MNIFYLDESPWQAARYHCDKHVVKMILESVQILSTVCHKLGVEVGYKPTHKNHPATLWAGKCVENFNWLEELTTGLNLEYQLRYSAKNSHKSYLVMKDQINPIVEKLPLPINGDITTPALCMPEECKVSCPVQSYRNYYIMHKFDIAKWKNRPIPKWYIEGPILNKVSV